MRVHFLGCGDAFGSGGRNHSAYLIETQERLVLLDCGPTALLSMKRAGLDPRRLDVVLLSHLHGDHFGGLPFLFLELLYSEPPAEPLHIAGPRGTEERVRALTECMYPGGLGPRELPTSRFHVLEPGRQTSVAGIEVFPFPVPHQTRQVSLGLKVRCEGKQVLFSGDSAWTNLFITHSRGTDLFICECSFYEQDDPGHMTYETIKEKIPELECKKLVLTHMGETMLSHIHDIPEETAEDGMIVEI